MDGLVFNSLEQANSINFDVSKRLVAGPVVAELDKHKGGVIPDFGFGGKV